MRVFEKTKRERDQTRTVAETRQGSDESALWLSVGSQAGGLVAQHPQLSGSAR